MLAAADAARLETARHGGDGTGASRGSDPRLTNVHVPISLTRLCTTALRYSLIMAGAKVGGEQLSAVSYSTAALSGRTAVAVGPQRLRFGGLTQPKHGIYLQHWL